MDGARILSSSIHPHSAGMEIIDCPPVRDNQKGCEQGENPSDRLKKLLFPPLIQPTSTEWAKFQSHSA